MVARPVSLAGVVKKLAQQAFAYDLRVNSMRTC
jgi:hypothetical protein